LFCGRKAPLFWSGSQYPDSRNTLTKRTSHRPRPSVWIDQQFDLQESFTDNYLLPFFNFTGVPPMKAKYCMFALALSLVFGASLWSQDVASDTTKAAKDTAHATKKGATKAAQGTEKAADKTADATTGAAKATAKGTDTAAKKTAHGTEDVAKATGKGVKKGTKTAAEDTEKGVKKVGDEMK
jgi:hypothetical protein